MPAEISVEGGEVSDVAPAAGAPGTRVVVRDLFFATPARRKFLKHPRTEADHAEAGGAPAGAGRPRRSRSGWRATAASRSTCRRRTAPPASRRCSAPRRPRRWCEVAGERGPLRITGYAGSPAVTRATAAAQALTVNGRPVADPVLKAAVRVAYRDVIAVGPPSGGGAVARPAAGRAGRERAPGEDRAALPRRGRGALAGDRQHRPRAGRRRRHVAAGAAAFAAPGAFRSPPVPYSVACPLPGMAETQLAFGAAPAARMLPAARTARRTIRSARRWRRCWTPT